jgi:7-cyano-7-deazaguanine synthase
MASIERKAFVLLSGGLDSTTCLYKAIYDYTDDNHGDISMRIRANRHAVVPQDYDPITWVEAVSINYGQRHKKEMDYAKKTCFALGIKHSILDLEHILGGAMLTDPSIEIPSVSYNDLPTGVSPTYVPFRNGTLLSLITAHAQKWVNSRNKARGEQGYTTEGISAGIYFGAHSEDAANWAYPDCTPEFIGAMANAIFIGSYQQIRLHTPLQWLMKSEIVELGEKLGVPFEDTWSCYKGEKLHCGICPTCRSRRDAFIRVGVKDPTEYANNVTVAAE